MKKILAIVVSIIAIFCGCTKDVGSNAFVKSPATVGQGGSLARFTIVDHYLYSVDEKQLKVFDIGNATEPVLKSTQDVGFQIETIFPFGDKLFIGSTTQVHIFSIANPAKPEKLSSAISPQVLRRCDPVVAKENVAYATLRTNGLCGGTQSILAVYDISNITNPVQVTFLPVGEPYGLGYSGDVLYVCDKQQGLLLYDISTPLAPKVIPATIKDGSYVDVIPYGNTLICWVTDGILLYDISDNRNPQLITSIK